MGVEDASTERCLRCRHLRRLLAARGPEWVHGLVSWSGEEAAEFAAQLIGMTESDVRSKAAQAGVDLRVIHAGRSEWHTNNFQRHGVTVTFEREIAVSAKPG
jgi:hypothetical protein